MERESKILEYKQEVTEEDLKTVSAFANYCNGKIIFGVTDDLQIIGIQDPEKTCLELENQINNNLSPVPDYSLRINEDTTISLHVSKGEETPYLYKGKAYKRNDSSTVVAGSLDLKRLTIESLNLNFEQLESLCQDLSFNILEKELSEILNLNDFNTDTLKSLNLYNDKQGYNNAAALLADTNTFPGLDIIVYGINSNEIRKRITLSGKSIIQQYFEILDIYKNEYVVETIQGGFRKTSEKIPFTAFREAVAHALIHRTWDISANTKVEMFDDHISISSPGGLPEGISEEQYLRGSFSMLRNPIISNVFYRLNIVEIFATGIRRINDSYKDSFRKPDFFITENSIEILLPVVGKISLSEEEIHVLENMKNNYRVKRIEIEKSCGYSKDKVIRVLNSLIDKHLVEKIGKTSNIVYIRK